MKSPAIVTLEAELVAQLEAVCASRTRELVRAATYRFFGTAPPASAKVLPFARPRKKAPIQLCPAPACANRAAPVFGMLCAGHKNVPKATVRAWRAERRLRKGR